MVRLDTNIFETAVTRIGCRIGLIVWCSLTALLVQPRVFSQPPGTYPPPEIVRQPIAPTTSESGKIPIKGILCFDINKSPIYLPPMTYEKWWQLEQESENQTPPLYF